MDPSSLSLAGPLEPRSDWTANSCPIASTMEVVGTRSAFLLLREAFYGTLRFDQLADRVGISQPVAASRLRELVAEGLLERRPYQEPGQRTRMEYHLTEKGTEFFPVLAAMMEWGDKWVRPSPVGLRHRSCGQAVHTELRCGDGHTVTLGEAELVLSDSSAGQDRTGRR
jgi:DNA-binding HxlR family transcriptional regulator